MSHIYIGTAGIPASSKEHSASGGIRRVAELGLQAMEVEFVRGVKMKVDTAKEIKNVVDETGIRLSVHAPYYINLASKEKIKIKESKQRILDSMELADAMGAWIVVVHPGFYSGRPEKTIHEMIELAALEIVDDAKTNGWKVILGMECMGKQGQYGTLDELLDLSKRVPRCQPVPDFCHIYARNAGKVDYVDILDKMSKFKDVHCHFSGVEFTVVGPNKGNEKRHIPIGDSPPFEPLAKEIVKFKSNITIINESPEIEGDAIKMRKIFEKLGHKFK